MHRFLLLMTALLCCGAYTSSYAIPRFALWKGEANCLSCHTNPTGGGIRTKGGEAFSKNVLAMWKRGDEFSGQISEGIRIGANFRNQYLSFSQSANGEEGPSNSTSHAMTAALMVNANLTNTVDLYVRYDPLNNYNEAFGTLHVVHESGELLEAGSVVSHAYIKGGAFQPAFGVRFEDHTLYTKGGNRSISGFGSAGFFWVDGYRDVGMEVGATFFDHIGLQVSFLNGNERSPRSNASFNPEAEKAIAARLTASAEVIDDEFAFEVGGSYYSHSKVDTDPDRGVLDLSIIGVHLGLRGGPVTLLAEYDMGENVYKPFDNLFVPKMQAMTTELSVRVVQGLEIIGRYETYKDMDENDVEGNTVDSRISFGAQWFPLRFVEVRPEFRIAKVKMLSENSPDPIPYDQTTFLIQTHLYF